MIDTSYRVEFPPDVSIGPHELRDDALEQTYPLNESARMHLVLLRDGFTMHGIVGHVSERFGIPPVQVERDLLRLVATLSDAQLINVQPRRPLDILRRYVLLIGFSAATGALPSLAAKRAYVDSRGPASVIKSVTASVLRHAVLPLLIIFVAVAGLAAVGDATAAMTVFGVCAAVIVALALHEVGHALAVHAVGGKSYLMMVGVKVGIVHNRPESPITHAAGPALPGVVGFAAIALASALDSTALAILSLPFVMQTASLTALCADGRALVACLSRPG